VEDIAHVRVVGDEVDVALAVARLDIAHAKPLAGDGQEALGERAQGAHHERQLARSGAHGSALDGDDVAEVELLEEGEGVAHLPRRAEELQLARSVAQLDEHQLARVAGGDDAPRDAVRGGRVVTVEGGRVVVGVGRVEVAEKAERARVVAEGVVPRGEPALGLVAALLLERAVGVDGVGHGGALWRGFRRGGMRARCAGGDGQTVSVPTRFFMLSRR
jgi:hypothetical protein